MKNHVLSAVLVLGFGTSAFAAPTPLSEGNFYSPGVCDARVINDLANGNILIEYVGNCSVAGEVDTYTAGASGAYGSIGQTQTVDAQRIAKCKVKKRNVLPCESWLYDEQKNYIPQVNDQVETYAQMTVLNPTAFLLTFSNRLVRNGTDVVKSIQTPGQSAYTQPIPKCENQ